MTLGTCMSRRLGLCRLSKCAAPISGLVLGLALLAPSSFAADNNDPASRHAALVTALRALDSGDASEVARAQAILLSVSPRGVDAQNDPAGELVTAYDLQTVEMPPSRGHMRGPVMKSGQLDDAIEEMSLVFEGGEKADVTLYANGSRTLEISASDKVLCRAQTADGVAFCSWMPMFSKSHTIRIIRDDTQTLPYTIIIN